MRPMLSAFVLTVLFAAASSASAQAPTLKVGDDAPKLYVSKWLNGKAVESFEKDKVYVVECWATWCGPCVQAIPHVSQLNTKLKDKGVVVIGLNVWEEDQSKVEPFIKKMGDKLNYVVALDDGGEAGKSAAAWLKAAGQNGIPCTFVVNKEGKIAWIGHPMAGLDRVVEKVAAGTFDAKAEAESAAKVRAIDEKIQAAAEAQKWDVVVKHLDEIAALRPEAKGQIGIAQVGILLVQKQDYAAGYERAAKLGESDLKDDSDGLNHLAWMILDDERIEKRDFELAHKLATRAAELSKYENPAILDTLALACFEKKQIDKAIELQKKAISKSQDDEEKEQMEATLQRYLKARDEEKK